MICLLCEKYCSVKQQFLMRTLLFCVLQLLPLRSQAAPGISSMSVEMDVVFQRGGSVMERTTVGTGLMRPSVQVYSYSVIRSQNT